MPTPQHAEYPIRTRYLDDTAVIQGGLYADGSTALRLLDASTGEPLAIATVCLVDSHLKPAEGHVFIKDWSENEGMYLELKSVGVVGEAIAAHRTGFRGECLAYECPLLIEPMYDE